MTGTCWSAYQLPFTFLEGDHPNAGRVVDLDGDGLLELITRTDEQLVVYRPTDQFELGRAQLQGEESTGLWATVPGEGIALCDDSTGSLRFVPFGPSGFGDSFEIGPDPGATGRRVRGLGEIGMLPVWSEGSGGLAWTESEAGSSSEQLVIGRVDAEGMLELARVQLGVNDRLASGAIAVGDFDQDGAPDALIDNYGPVAPVMSRGVVVKDIAGASEVGPSEVVVSGSELWRPAPVAELQRANNRELLALRVLPSSPEFQPIFEFPDAGPENSGGTAQLALAQGNATWVVGVEHEVAGERLAQPWVNRLDGNNELEFDARLTLGDACPGGTNDGSSSDRYLALGGGGVTAPNADEALVVTWTCEDRVQLWAVELD